MRRPCGSGSGTGTGAASWRSTRRRNGTSARKASSRSGATSSPARSDHSCALGDVVRALQGRHLLGRHQPGMVVLVPGERQAPALDGVGDEAVRPVVRRAVERLEQGLQVVPAEIGHQRGQRRVVMPVEQGADAGIAAEIALQMRPPGGAALEAQGGVEVVRAGVDPFPQRLAARLRERLLQLLAVLDGDHAPADRGEELLDLGEQQLRHDPVQALAVVVDHPPEIADVVLPALEQGLVDVALVELGVADNGHHPARRCVVGHQPVQTDVVLGQRGEQRHRRTQAHRPRREVDAGLVLGARRIGLRAAQRPELLQLLDRLAAEQVHGRVVDRARVRLDRDPVAGPQHVEIEGGHDARDRRAGRLMPADLQLVAAGAQVIGVVDGPAGQPEQLPLDRLQHRQAIRGQRLGARRHLRELGHRLPLICAAWSVARADVKGPGFAAGGGK